MNAARGLTSRRLLRLGIAAMRGGLLMIGVLTLIAAAVATAGPRIASGVLASELSYRLTTASANALDLQASVDPVPTTTSDDFVTATAKTWAAFDSELPIIHNSMPLALKAVAGAGRYVGRNDGGTHSGIPASGAPHGPPKRFLTLSLEGNPELRSDAALVSGAWPTSVPDDDALPIPVVVSAATATELEWHVGEVQTLKSFTDQPRQIVLVGTVRPRHPSADYWQLDTSRVKAPGIPSTDGDSTTFHGVIWLDSDSWPTISWEFEGAAIRSWFPVDGSRVSPSELSPVQSALARFSSSAQRVGSGENAVSPRYTSNFSLVASAYLDRAGAASGVLSLINAGPLGTAGALLLLAVSLLVERRRVATRLQRARGATDGQLRGELAGQLAVATLPGAVLGVILGLLISPGAPGIVAVLVVAAVAATLPLLVGVTQLAPPWSQRMGESGARRARLVFDGILVLVAALDTLLLIQRGLAGEAPSLAADPLLTVTPLILSAAGCALALRALPPVLRALGSLVRRGRGAVALIGRANSARVGARFLPVFATVTGIAIALFASSILATQQRGLTDAGVGEIGSDIRISAGQVSDAHLDALRALPGVADLVVVNAIGGVQVPGHAETFPLYSVDHAQLIAVESDLSAQKRRFPLLGTKQGGTPVAYSGGFLQPLSSHPRLEGSMSLAVNSITNDDPPPKFVSSSPWVVLDASAVPEAQLNLLRQDSVMIRVTPGADPDRVTRSIRSVIGTGPVIASALDRVRDLTASPLVPGLTTVVLAAIALSVLFSVLALLLTLLMNTGSRAVLLARVRALGFARRQAVGLIGWELGPMVVLGALAGAVLGIVVAVLFLSAVDLSTFVGGTSPPLLSIDPALALASLAVFVVSAALATVGTAIAATRSLSSTHRTRELDPS
ncbi:MAG: FtsX-like permease family protein [Pseudolysinimonas sp.]